MSSRASASCPAPAKVNLLLRVLGTRADGFHEIETLFQAADLHDGVEVSFGGPRGVTLEVVGRAPGPPTSNLAYRACRAVLDAVASDAALHVRLVKRLPAGAGLGGGSSDAAAALRCVNALLDAGLDDARLAELGAELGSDVPFFLGRSTLALGTGRGEMLEALPPLPEASLVIVTPPVHVATAWAYRALDDHRRERRAGEAPCSAPRGDRPRSWREVAALADNDFEPVVVASHPEVARSLEALRAAGAAPALLSGSGSACFGVFVDEERATAAAVGLTERLGWPAVVARTLNAWPPVRVEDR